MQFHCCRPVDSNEGVLHSIEVEVRFHGGASGQKGR